ncbi:MAG: hypothetical protein COU22_01455 [Candidatus Komeilibacteria bacterium CG10_big_fil_rev_8_21_14_0_10_41_13]|uniref:Uncharacterized protein n=1 Tax=Candidatus Komeilibacteria bacterium CG10_big_fil_rev_8_21_14_0_10_41_13 TaxID=1974476 RepID=A0A2M6WCP2_9BACT|nr:MAG: hypothetical protein COU22_01455 [Candidatus Komeilibacteria bacterium CG10_big_fil_rev_8_21_14_0_10_41_13]
MDIIGILNYLGITPDRIVPLVILGLVIYIILHTSLKPFKRITNRIRDALIEIQAILKREGIDLEYKVLEAPGSPVRPTKIGAELIKKSGLEKILDQKKEFLADELKKILPEDYTEYDVQEKARELLVSLASSSLMNPVKEYAYQEGTSVVEIFKVGGLWLRDDFLGQKRMVKDEDK